MVGQITRQSWIGLCIDPCLVDDDAKDHARQGDNDAGSCDSHSWFVLSIKFCSVRLWARSTKSIA